jgi:hypothetical protein
MAAARREHPEDGADLLRKTLPVSDAMPTL